LIEWYPNGYLAYFPALEGYNTWGKTYEEAIKHAEETLTLYLESFDELRKSIPEERGLKQPTSLGLTVRFPVNA
jgi:predicted RNase H-like HicB family nuclease